MIRRKWMAFALVLAVLINLFPAAVFAEGGEPAVLSGRLSIRGDAYVGALLEPEWKDVVPEGLTAEDVEIRWFRGENEAAVLLSEQGTYTVKADDVGFRIELRVAGREDRGFSGSLSAKTGPTATTKEEAEALKAGAATAAETPPADVSKKAEGLPQEDGTYQQPGEEQQWDTVYQADPGDEYSEEEAYAGQEGYQAPLPDAAEETGYAEDAQETETAGSEGWEQYSAEDPSWTAGTEAWEQPQEQFQEQSELPQEQFQEQSEPPQAEASEYDDAPAQEEAGVPGMEIVTQEVYVYDPDGSGEQAGFEEGEFDEGEASPSADPGDEAGTGEAQETESIPEDGSEAPEEMPEPEPEQAGGYAAEAGTADGSGTVDFGAVGQDELSYVEYQTVSVTNVGSGELHFAEIAPEHFMVQDIVEPLEPGETIDLWIAPRDSLLPGEYADTIRYESIEGAQAEFTAVVRVGEPENMEDTVTTETQEGVEEMTRAPVPDEPKAVTTTEPEVVTTTEAAPVTTTETVTAPATEAEPETKTEEQKTTTTEEQKTSTTEEQKTTTEKVTETTTESTTEAPEVIDPVVLTGIRAPAPVTGIPCGSPKTPEGLGLPGTVVITTNAGSRDAAVTWDAAGCAYDPSLKTVQTFTVNGKVVLPEGIQNPRQIPLRAAVKVTVNGRAPYIADPSGNRIDGIADGQVFTTENKITFTAVGAGYDNTSPVSGDIRYIPVLWNVLENRTWDREPFSATFRLGQGGKYTLTVTFWQQQFNGSSWANTGGTDVRKVAFTVQGGKTVTMSPVPKQARAARTGDETDTAALLLLLAAAVTAGMGSFLYLFFRKKRR